MNCNDKLEQHTYLILDVSSNDCTNFIGNIQSNLGSNLPTLFGNASYPLPCLSTLIFRGSGITLKQKSE